MYPLGKRAMETDNPNAIRTKLGWLIFGNIEEVVQEEHMLITQEEDEMHNMMRNYFSTEDCRVRISQN